jgi:hypothetical protein
MPKIQWTNLSLALRDHLFDRPSPGGSAEHAAATVHRSFASSLWATLLARIYEVFPLACPHCGAPMRIIAFVTDTASVTHMLRHLGEPTEPAPAFQFDQTLSW